MTPEARARQSIDALIVAAGWAVRGLTSYRIVLEVDRPTQLSSAKSRQRLTLNASTQALRQATLFGVFGLNSKS